MKKLLPAALFAALLVSACGPTPPSPPPSPAEQPLPEAKFPVHCYEQRLPDGSVLSFQYTEYYDDIVGILDYSFAEKDGAHGTFKGQKVGNVITAVWDYTVEGAQQQEEIMVKIEGNKAIKASGELVEAPGGLLKLKDPAGASWVETFDQVACD